MNQMCGDNRFEVIEKAKAHLLKYTNIETAEDEMKVLNRFLFRCWQMGWLKQYDDNIEAEPVRHGEWIDPEEYTGHTEWHCSYCGDVVCTTCGYPGANYCSVCGTKMDGGAKE